MSCVRDQLTKLGIPDGSAEIIMSFWRDRTKAQYQTYIKKWSKFCSTTNCEFFNPPIAKIIEFFTELFHLDCHFQP